MTELNSDFGNSSSSAIEPLPQKTSPKCQLINEPIEGLILVQTCKQIVRIKERDGMELLIGEYTDTEGYTVFRVSYDERHTEEQFAQFIELLLQRGISTHTFTIGNRQVVFKLEAKRVNNQEMYTFRCKSVDEIGPNSILKRYGTGNNVYNRNDGFPKSYQ